MPPETAVGSGDIRPTRIEPTREDIPDDGYLLETEEDKLRHVQAYLDSDAPLSGLVDYLELLGRMDFPPMPLRPRPTAGISGPALRDQEAWQCRVQAVIDRRLAEYATGARRRHERPGNEFPPAGLPAANPSAPCSAAQHVFDTGELVEIILRFAGPTAQLLAYNLSPTWRAASQAFINDDRRSEYGAGSPHRPVNYGDVMPNAHILHPSSTVPQYQIDKLRLLTTRAQNGLFTSPLPRFSYWPAILTQDPRVNVKLATTIVFIYQTQIYTYPYLWANLGSVFTDDALLRADLTLGLHARVSIPRPHPLRFLDLSQFSLNPFFAALFPSRIGLHGGAYEITLPPYSSHIRDARISPVALQGVASLFVTSPPVTTLALTIRVPAPVGPWIQGVETLDTVHDGGGVRVGMLVGRMEALERRVKGDWRFWTQMMRNTVAENAKGTDYWCVRARPVVVVRLVRAPGDDPLLQFGGPYEEFEVGAAMREEGMRWRQREWMEGE